ncbi:hypothetical protein C5F59_006215 [Streptomyces sp. QL37]|uniref:hypothetical protein n=1 Tax=Streptomyces sp. QL37 TaxID=2093747 RepID=UPI000CF21FE7|nr:hypothetical protein [Streptomyces sp. QL37]PPQ56327.1 hypothetical protein C5F59_06290 [Streptomyces sp. QL37]
MNDPPDGPALESNDFPPDASPRPRFDPDPSFEPTEPQADSGLILPEPKAGANLKIWELSGMATRYGGGKCSRDVLIWNGLDEDLYLAGEHTKWGNWPQYECRPPNRIRPHSGTSCSLLKLDAGVEGSFYYRTDLGHIRLYVYFQSWNNLTTTNSQWHVYYASPDKAKWLCAFDTSGRNFWMEGTDEDWDNGWKVQTYESPYFGNRGAAGDPILLVVNRPAVGDVSVGSLPKRSQDCETYKAAYKNGLRSAHWFDGTVGSVLGAHIGSWIRGCP